jgi:hypothetical protein
MSRSAAEATALIEKCLDREAPESKSLQNDLGRAFDDPGVRERFGKSIAAAVLGPGRGNNVVVLRDLDRRLNSRTR